MAEQARGLGLPPEALAAMERTAARGAPEHIGVWPENWGAVRVFLAMGTQWRRAGMGGVPVGLDYAALPAIAGALGVPADADLLARLRVMEAEAGQILRARHVR